MRFDATNIRLGLIAQVAIGGFVYDIESPGSIQAPSIAVAAGRFGDTIFLPEGTGPSCTAGDCIFQLRGFLAGDGASHAGFVYTIKDARIVGLDQWIDGAAVFIKGGLVVGAPVLFDKDYGGITVDKAFVQPVAGQFSSFIDLSLVGSGVDAPERLRRIRDLQTPSDTSNTLLTEVEISSGVGSIFRSIGTASNANNGALGNEIGWTRWTDGIYQDGRGNGIDLTGSASVNYLFGRPTVEGRFPTGRAEYVLAGGTRPTRRDGLGDPGSIEGALVVDFATRLVGWDTIIAMSDDRFNFFSDGGTNNPSITLIDRDLGRSGFQPSFAGEGTVISEQGRCTGCTGLARGLVAGLDAEYAGFAYTINTVNFGAIDGVAVFAQPEGPDMTSIREKQDVLVQRPRSLNNSMPDRLFLRGVQTVVDTGTQIDLVTQSGVDKIVRDIAQVAEQGRLANGDIVWSRWANGNFQAPVQGDDRALGERANEFGLHILSLNQAINVPTTGTATYDYVGGITPVSGGTNNEEFGSMGGQVSVAFGATPKIGVNLAVSFDRAGDFVIATPGGVDDPSQSPLAFFSASQFNGSGNWTTGSSCGTVGCSTVLSGSLAGDGASSVGLSFHTTFGISGIHGLAAFERSGATSTAPTATMLAIPAAPSSAGAADWSRWTGKRVGAAMLDTSSISTPALHTTGKAEDAEQMLGGMFTFDN